MKETFKLNDTTSVTTTFTMSSNEVTLVANYEKEVAASEYLLTIRFPSFIKEEIIFSSKTSVKSSTVSGIDSECATSFAAFTVSS